MELLKPGEILVLNYADDLINLGNSPEFLLCEIKKKILMLFKSFGVGFSSREAKSILMEPFHFWLFAQHVFRIPLSSLVCGLLNNNKTS